MPTSLKSNRASSCCRDLARCYTLQQQLAALGHVFIYVIKCAEAAHHCVGDLLQVPYFIVVNTARFTTSQHKGSADEPGMSVLQGFNILQSFTFAALPDDSLDGGLLSWLNIQLPGFDGVFAMNRRFFLTWISFMDAGSMAVFSIACMVLYKLSARFAQAVDDATMEVADYTVLIKGLPETTPIDVSMPVSVQHVSLTSAIAGTDL